MSENTSCNSKCVIGKTRVDTKLPKLVSPSEVVAVKRPCKGKASFNVPWCHRVNGWPAGSMVYTKCGYYFNVERAMGNPDMADSEWIQFDFQFLFMKLLEAMSCEGCPTLDEDVKHWDGDEGAVNVASFGETWCFLVMDDNGEQTYMFACAKEDNLIQNPFDKPEAWSELKTSKDLMCLLLNGGLDGQDGQDGADGADGADITTCSMDYLVPHIFDEPIKHVMAVRATPANLQNGNNQAGISFQFDGVEQPAGSFTFTKAMLDAAGMRPTDNAVVVRVDAVNQIDYTGEDFPNIGAGLNTKTMTKGCDGAQERLINTATAINLGSDSEDARILSDRSITIKLNADGSFNAEQFVQLTAAMADLNEIGWTSVWRVEESKRVDPANSCYQAADPTCLGVDTSGN